ncbi:hypothetical protein DMA11_14925 [Marinilabiliaceae bacterium JC017]|nr:hypothetical protein DMA11_14925 [Marinilabiliaceae bacterium JC017]
MSHKLNDITLYYYPKGEEAKAFTVKQNVVSDLYVTYLDNYKPPKTSRISVELSHEDHIRGYFGSILLVNAQFNKLKYWNLNEDEKNLLILNTIHRISIQCAKKYGWNIEVFNSAYEKIIEKNFVFEIETLKKTSKDRKNKASILVEKNEKIAAISAVFYDKNEEKEKTIKLIDTFQWAGFHIPIIRKFKWFDKEYFGLNLYYGELVIKASILSNEVIIEVNPKQSTKEEIEGYLREITYREFKTEKDIIDWINY